jgi:outer membrane immunogenic protein
MRSLLKSLLLAAGVISVGSVAGVGGVAMAADVVRPPPVVAKPIVVAPRFSWTGHYIGVQGGWDNNQAETPPYSADEDGGILGVFGGWNFAHVGALVWGFDASANWTNARGCDPDAPDCDAGPTFKGFLRGRVGLPLDRLLFYGTFGAAVMHYTADVDCCGSGSATPWGWTAGLGLDWAWSDRHFLRLDWAYQDYGTFTLDGSGAVDGTEVSVTANTFMIGVGWKL